MKLGFVVSCIYEIRKRIKYKWPIAERTVDPDGGIKKFSLFPILNLYEQNNGVVWGIKCIRSST